MTVVSRWVFELAFASLPVEVGLVQGKHLSVDGSFVEANAAKESRIPREQLGDAAQDMLTRFAEWQGRTPESVAADTTYGNGEFLQRRTYS